MTFEVTVEVSKLVWNIKFISEDIYFDLKKCIWQIAFHVKYRFLSVYQSSLSQFLQWLKIIVAERVVS